MPGRTACTEGDPWNTLQPILRKYPSSGFRKGRIHTNVFVGCVVMGTEGMGADIYRGGFVNFQKPGKPAAMIVVTVRENSEIHLGQIDAQLDGVLHESMALSGIEKDFCISGFDIQAQTVFAEKRFGTSGVFHQDGDLHSRAPFPMSILSYLQVKSMIPESLWATARGIPTGVWQKRTGHNQDA